jgi:hypothetical protein
VTPVRDRPDVTPAQTESPDQPEHTFLRIAPETATVRRPSTSPASATLALAVSFSLDGRKPAGQTPLRSLRARSGIALGGDRRSDSAKVTSADDYSYRASICRRPNASSVAHDAVHTFDLPAGNQTTDAEICRLADVDGRVVVTKDADLVRQLRRRRGARGVACPAWDRTCQNVLTKYNRTWNT